MDVGRESEGREHNAILCGIVGHCPRNNHNYYIILGFAGVADDARVKQCRREHVDGEMHSQ